MSSPIRVQVNLYASESDVRAITELFRSHGLTAKIKRSYYNPHEAEDRTVTVVNSPVDLPPEIRGGLLAIRGGDVSIVGPRGPEPSARAG